MSSVLPNDDTPLDDQIYAAHIEWNNRTYDYDRLESMRKAVHAHWILEKVKEEKKAVSRATLEVEDSKESKDYMRERDDAKRAAADAKAKYEYLCNLSVTQRNEGYRERFHAKL